MDLTGWLLDVYPLHDRMILWCRTDRGETLRLEDPFRCPIYASGKRSTLDRLAEAAVRKGFAADCSWVEKRELQSGKEIEVLALRIGDYDRLPRFLRRLPALEDTVSFFNCDLPLGQYYLYSRGIFPLGRCAVEFEEEKLRAIRTLESAWD